MAVGGSVNFGNNIGDMFGNLALGNQGYVEDIVERRLIREREQYNKDKDYITNTLFKTFNKLF